MSNKILFFFLFLFSLTTLAQEEESEAIEEQTDSSLVSLAYDVEAVGLAKGGDYVPFYMVSNNHGKISPENSMGYLEGKITFGYDGMSGVKVQAGLDMIAYATKNSPYYHNNFRIHQAYADVSIKKFGIGLGMKEENPFLVNPELSSGNMLWSNNSRPMPRVKIGTTDFVPFPGTNHWLNFYLDAEYGWYLNGTYEDAMQMNHDQKNCNYHYCLFVKDLTYHRKNFFLSSKQDAVFSAMVGFEHVALLGGATNGMKRNVAMKDYMRSFFASGDYANSLSADMKFTLNLPSFSLSAYGQRFIDSAPFYTPLFENGMDGLWGVEVKLNDAKYVKGVVLEYLGTSCQEGPVNANEEYSYGNMAERYTNGCYYNDDTFGAWSYFGMSCGSPLLKSPIYNKDNHPLFTSTLVKAFHMGVNGNITDKLDYKLLFSFESSWGEPFALYNKRCDNVSLLLQASYKHKGWCFTPVFAFDKGDVFGNNTAFELKVSKFGNLLRKKL